MSDCFAAWHAYPPKTDVRGFYWRQTGVAIPPAGKHSAEFTTTDGDNMKSLNIAKSVTAIAILATFGGCSSWQGMDKTQGTVAGAAGGAVAGAVVGGPVGAVVGGVGGAYVGNETTGNQRTASSTPSAATSSSYDSGLVRSVQQALNDKGYNAGAVDGRWGPTTEDAVRRFQQAMGLPRSGELERSTLAALGVTSRM